jgi:hypothetical protein
LEGAGEQACAHLAHIFIKPEAVLRPAWRGRMV